MKRLYIVMVILSMLMLSSCEDTVQTSTESTDAPIETKTPATIAATEAVVIQSTEEAVKKDDDKEMEIILSGESNPKDGYAKTFSNACDVTGDGIKDNVSLYVKAESDEDGVLLFEDSQEWFLEVSDGISAYTLYKGEISHGNAYAEISEYYIGEKAVPVISFIKSSGTGLSVTNYTYNNDKKGFEKDDVFTTDKLCDGGVNKIASSLPEVKAIK